MLCINVMLVINSLLLIFHFEIKKNKKTVEVCFNILTHKKISKTYSRLIHHFLLFNPQKLNSVNGHNWMAKHFRYSLYIHVCDVSLNGSWFRPSYVKGYQLRYGRKNNVNLDLWMIKALPLHCISLFR